MSWLRSFFGTANTHTAMAANSSAADAITYLASLASHPKDVDPMLDTLRQVSAHQPKSGLLSDQDQLALAGVYQKLLRYLVEQEPLRAFTRDELVAKVRNHFKPRPTEAAFWRDVGA